MLHSERRLYYIVDQRKSDLQIVADRRGYLWMLIFAVFDSSVSHHNKHTDGSDQHPQKLHLKNYGLFLRF